MILIKKFAQKLFQKQHPHSNQFQTSQNIKIIQKFKIAVCQNEVSREDEVTQKMIEQIIDKAASNNPQIIIMGETFNCFYNKPYMVKAAEDFSDPNSSTIPEKTQQGQYYNTAVVINPEGELQEKFRKMHLFDIDIPGKITYKESDTFSAGDEVLVMQTEYGKIGMAICYDIRFPELALLMAQKGAQILVYPGSFNLTTGPLHWELLLRGRAIDNLCYVIGSCVARFTGDPNIYQAWGHSTIIDPFGRILQKAEEKSTILYQDIDLDLIDELRGQIPIYKQKRFDIYKLSQLKH